MYDISCLLEKLQNKMYLNKERRFAARDRSRIRKNVLQNAKECVSDKRKNLEDLVQDLDWEDNLRCDANSVVSHHDILTWVLALKNQENSESRFKEMSVVRQNQMLAQQYFEGQKHKNTKDAQFLEAKTFSRDMLDLDELYVETRNLRRVIDVYNQQKIKNVDWRFLFISGLMFCDKTGPWSGTKTSYMFSVFYVEAIFYKYVHPPILWFNRTWFITCGQLVIIGCSCRNIFGGIMCCANHFATITIAVRRIVSPYMYPGCISSTIVFGFVSGVSIT